MKKLVVSSLLILSMTAFMINFCACGTKAPEAPAQEAQQQIQPEVVAPEAGAAQEMVTRGPGSVVKLTSEAEFNQLIAQGNVVVDFFAEWCGPCKQLSPVIDQIAQENSNITFIKVNVDNFSSLSSKYNVKGIPTLIFFKNGQKVDKSSGAQSKSSLQSKLNGLFR